MKNVLILDTETTGLGDDAVCIEVGCILYSIEFATELVSYSSLLRHDGDNPVESINRIPAAALPGGPIPEAAWALVQDLASYADAILAHNAEFDRRFVPTALRDMRPWICTKADIEWPKQTRPESSLVPLALEHDLGVAVAHRALADCQLISRLLTRSAELGCDLDAMLTRGLRDKVTLRADVSFDDKDKAKAQGFYWQPKRREWLRRMPIDDASEFDFRTTVVVDDEERR